MRTVLITAAAAVAVLGSCGGGMQAVTVDRRPVTVSNADPPLGDVLTEGPATSTTAVPHPSPWSSDGSQVSIGRLQEELAQARSSWERSEPDQYVLWLDYYAMGYGGPRLITVVEGRVVEHTAADGSQTVLSPLTVEDLFAILRRKLVEGAQHASAVFDPSTGLPTTVRVDPDGNIADEEIGWEARLTAQRAGDGVPTVTPRTPLPTVVLSTGGTVMEPVLIAANATDEMIRDSFDFRSSPVSMDPPLVVSGWADTPWELDWAEWCYEPVASVGCGPRVDAVATTEDGAAVLTEPSVRCASLLLKLFVPGSADSGGWNLVIGDDCE